MMKKGAKVWSFILILTVVGLMFSGLIITTSATTEKTTVSVTDLSPWFTKGTNSGIGPWYPYTKEDHDHIATYVGGMSWLGGSPSEPDCWARFKPYLSQPGEYEVYAYFYAWKDTSTIVPFTVRYEGGTKTIKVDQSSSIPTWKEESLGTWNFKAGQDTYVEVTDATGEPYYDGCKGLTIGAIKFVKKETVPTPAKILTVPYYNQGNTNWCVPTSMSMIFKYYGHNIKSWDIAKDWSWSRDVQWWNYFEPSSGKVLEYFNRHGLPADEVSANFDTIKASIDEDKPVLLSMGGIGGIPHAVVIVGYSISGASEKVYINDPSGALMKNFEESEVGSLPYIAVQLDWNDVASYIGWGWASYAIAVGGTPSPPKGTIDLQDYGFYFCYPEKPNFAQVYSWFYGLDKGLIWEHYPRHPLWLDQRDLFKFDQYIANQMEDKQSYSLEIKFAKEGYSRSHFVEIPDVDGRSRKGDIMIDSKPLREILYESGDYTITLRLWDEDRTKIYDEIVFPSIEYSPPTPLTKTVKAVHEAIFEPATAEMTISYNWFGQDENGEDVYVISEIDCQSLWFVGYYWVSIESQTDTIWRDEVMALPFGKTYSPPFTPSRFGKPCPEEMQTSEGMIKVHAYDWISVKAYGVTESEMLTIVKIVMVIMGLPTMPASPPFFSESAAMYIAPDWIDTSDFPPIVIEEIEILPATLGHLCSPGELRIYDSQGRVTGLLNGEIKQEIPDSAYFNGSFVILSPSDSYCYEVEGTETGTYDLGVISIGIEKVNAFGATDIPISPNAIHQYTIDWAALSQGEKGVTVKIDSDGDGVFEKTVIADNKLSQEELTPTLPVHNTNTGESFSSIQAAVDAASAGDTIIVRDGTYTENVDIDKSITLKSSSGNLKNTIAQAANPNDHIFEITADYVNISGFTVEEMAGWKAVIFLNEVNYCNISNNHIFNNTGIHLNYSNDNIIMNNNISKNGDGILLDSSNSNTVFNNTFSGYSLYSRGIGLMNSTNNLISDNTICNCPHGGIELGFASSNNIILNNTFKSCGLCVWGYEKNTVEGNTVNDKPLIYLENVRQIVVDNAGQVILVNCEQIKVIGCNLSNATIGIDLLNSSNCVIENNICRDNFCGGIDLFDYSSNNIVLNNIIGNNFWGIFLTSYASNNKIVNNICENNYFGIHLSDTNNNRIYLNNLNNDCNVQSYNSCNIWNSKEKITYSYNGKSHTKYLGNYWSDYTGTDANKNGIGDSPYSIDDRGGDIDQDYYPLMTWSEHYFPSPTIPTPPTSTLTPTPRPRLTPPTSTLTPTPRSTLTPRPTLTPAPRPTLRPTATLFEKIEGLIAAIRVGAGI